MSGVQICANFAATSVSRVNVRVVAATNVNLEDEVREGRFREDLFFRLNVFPIRIPPLRDRRDDIPLLLGYFLQRYNARRGRKASHYFRQPVRAEDVLWTYSGVRPLLDDEAGNAAAVTRDYRLELHRDGPPMLTVWGGKITTYRKLAEEAAGVVADALGRASRPWTAHVHLPGGDLSAFIGAAQAPDADFARFLGVLEQSHAWLPAPMRYRMARAYGARIIDLLGEARCLADLGEMLAPGVCARELDYLRQTEWARTGDDVLWRRSKLGLHLNAEQRAAIDAWMAGRPDSFHPALQAAFESHA